MPIKQFNFPGVSLTQEFVASNVGSQAVLSVACIGRPYYLHRADVESEAAIESVTYATAGVTVTIPGRTTEHKLDGSTSTAAIDTDTVYNSLVVYDGDFTHAEVNVSGTAPTTTTTTTSLTIKLAKRVKSGYNYSADTVFGTREAQIGDKVDIWSSSASLCKGTITDISASGTNTGYDTIEVALVGTVTAGTVAKVQFIVTEDAEWKGDTGWTLSGTDSAAIAANLKTTIGGVANAALRAGIYDFAIQYREVNTVYEGYLGQVYNSDDVDAVLGGACMANPLALAVKLAALAAPGTMVYFTTPKSSLASTSDGGFKEALDFLDKYEEIYSIVPLTNNMATIALLLNDILASEADEESKVRRSLWFGLDPQLDPTRYSRWIDPTTTNTVRVADLISLKKEVPASYKAQAVWSDGATYNGEEIPNYILAAAPAGMRSYQPCHRPLSNLGYTFVTLKESKGFTRSQLKQIGAEGIWIIGNNQDDLPINLRQLTTAVANDINKDEESIIANVDEISLGLCRLGEDKVGCSNITPVMLMALTDDIKIYMDTKLVNQTDDPYIGPQLNSWNLDSIYQDPIQLDHVYATITCEPPKPFNQFKMTLRVI